MADDKSDRPDEQEPEPEVPRPSDPALAPWLVGSLRPGGGEGAEAGGADAGERSDGADEAPEEEPAVAAIGAEDDQEPATEPSTSDSLSPQAISEDDDRPTDAELAVVGASPGQKRRRAALRRAALALLVIGLLLFGAARFFGQRASQAPAAPVAEEAPPAELGQPAEPLARVAPPVEEQSAEESEQAAGEPATNRRGARASAETAPSDEEAEGGRAHGPSVGRFPDLPPEVLHRMAREAEAAGSSSAE